MVKSTENEKCSLAGKGKEEKEFPPEKIVILSVKEYENLKGWGDKYLRLLAEFDNFKKRTAKEKKEILKFSRAELLKELFPIIDNFDRAYASIEKKHNFEALSQGVKNILKELHLFLEKNGIKKIEAKGKRFDPTLHHAVLSVETDEYEDEVIIEELEKGYLLDETVIKPSVVKVAKKKEVHKCQK